jgi:hypothetical protein
VLSCCREPLQVNRSAPLLTASIYKPDKCQQVLMFWLLCLGIASNHHTLLRPPDTSCKGCSAGAVCSSMRHVVACDCLHTAVDLPEKDRITDSALACLVWLGLNPQSERETAIVLRLEAVILSVNFCRCWCTHAAMLSYMMCSQQPCTTAWLWC